jgi:hypothetical protein
MPRASLRSVLLICAFNIALMCAAAGINFDASQSLSNTLAHNQIAAVTSDFTTVSAAKSAITAFIAAHPNGTAVAADRFAS